jgi:putative transposase
LSFRDIGDLLAERGIIVTHETIRQWCLRFGQEYANSIRRRRPQPGDKWHLDEVFIKLLVSGFPVYRPGRVDQESKIEAMRRYGGDLQNILRKRSQVFG